jgi:flagellar basal-body rod protein FlgF
MGSNTYISASGATARFRDLDVVSNNLANIGTPGFKRGESIFRAAFEASLRSAEGRLQSGAPASAFVATDLVGTDFGRGSADRTGAPLHAMIDGPGFFEIETERGPRYTRAGNFVVNRQGELAAPTGDPVLGEGGVIVVPDGDARIEPTGDVIDRNGNVLGRLQVVEFQNLQGLEKEGLGLFRAGEEMEPLPLERPILIPGSVEGSNVEGARELATLVILQRAFETNLQAMQTDDETTRRLIEGIR